MMQVLGLFMWLPAGAGAVAWALLWLGGFACGSHHVSDVFVSFQQSRYVVHLLPFREVVQRDYR